ncbi:MAG: integrase, partial [Telmatospirillum sp.]|nr:integrase [Telmatospirillum sp.]
MPTGTYVRKNAVRDRLKAGMAANHAEDFAQWLRERRYTPLTIIERERLLACWTHWADAEGYTLDAIREAYAASFALIESGDRPCFRGDLNKDSVECAKLFINYLRERGVLPPAERRPSPEETWPILAAFRRWMREQRGLMDSTLDHYQLTLVDLLAILGDDPSTYTAVNIRN